MFRHAEEIQRLRQAVRSVCGCESIHHESVVVTEMLDYQPMYQHLVEVFRLLGHPDTTFAYAWRDPRRRGEQDVVVFGAPPVYTARDAVEAAAVRAASEHPMPQARAQN